MSKINTTSENWNIYRENSRYASIYGRAVAGGILILYFKFEDINLKLIALYFLLDTAQYVLSAVMYNIVARLQELKKIPGHRPNWVNYPAKVLWISKFVVLTTLLVAFL